MKILYSSSSSRLSKRSFSLFSLTWEAGEYWNGTLERKQRKKPRNPQEPGSKEKYEGRKSRASDNRKCKKIMKHLLLDGHSHVGLDLTESFHQELRLVRRLGQLLWFVNSKVMLFTKL